MTESQSMVELLEQCLPLIEDRHLRCCYSELWCFITMCAAIMLLKIHLGKESNSTAKASCAEKFLDLHYRQIDRQTRSLSNRQSLLALGPVYQVNVSHTPYLLPISFSGYAQVINNGFVIIRIS